MSSLSGVLVGLHLAGGVLINLLLLYAIRRFSRQSMGSYKYLLATFSSFDIFLSVFHASTCPTVVIVDCVFGVITDTEFEDRRITSAYCTFCTIPFVLMIIHFLYRFWAIRYSHLISLFSNKKFILLMCLFTINCFIIWYLIGMWLMCGEVGEMGTMILAEEYARRYGKTLRDGWLVNDFGEESGFRVRALATMISFDLIMLSSLSIGITLAAATYHYIAQDKHFSSQTLNLQYKLLIAVCAQTLVPVVFVYLPYLGVNHLAFLRVPAYSMDRACMHLTACFPAWDAIIIVVLIRDYREGILSIILPKKTTINIETTWKTNMVTSIASPSTIGNQ